MFLRKLSFLSFRNYERVEHCFGAPVTVLVGNNAEGKSNFLEGVYFLSTTKSQKGEKDEELIKREEDISRVCGEVEVNGGDVISLEVALSGMDGGKRVKVNGVPRRVVDYIGHFPVVPFAPEDINLVAGSPSLRRWHLDLTLAQVDREYKRALTAYENVVANKNRLLKNVREGVSRPHELDFWIEQQLLHGRVVADKRRDFFSKINGTERKFGDFFYEYQESELSRERLDALREREVYAGASLVGPHRDDFKFLDRTGGELRDLSHFGSRGEQRVAVLDLKFAEVFFIEDVCGMRPVLLLDDVFSELDLSHRQHVLELTGLQQTIIAAVELDGSLKSKLNGADVLRVEGGVLCTDGY